MKSAAQVLFDAARLIAGLALASMVVVITLEIAVRNVLGPSLQISDELGGYLLVAMAFFAISDAYRAQVMMRIEFVYDRFQGRAKACLDLFYDLIALAATLVLVWFSARFAISSWNRGVNASTFLETPQWLPQLPIPIGLTLLALAICLSMAGSVRQLLGRH
jgi:TRAP-type C4-dicarboxylate transport system permease small subunit